MSRVLIINTIGFEPDLIKMFHNNIRIDLEPYENSLLYELFWIGVIGDWFYGIFELNIFLIK